MEAKLTQPIRRVFLLIMVAIGIMLVRPQNIIACEDCGGLIKAEIYEMPDDKLEAIGLLDEESEQVGIAASKSQTWYMNELIRQIKIALLNGKTSIDISSYNIDVQQYDEIRNIKFFCPYIDNTNLNVDVYVSGGKYSAIKIKNLLSLEDTKVLINKVDAKISEYLLEVNDANLSQADIAMKLHDEMIIRCQYDTSQDNPLNYNYKKHSFYQLLMEGKGVCQGYSYMYMYLLGQKGIDTYYVSSEAMNHAWNQVKIDGYYYHVDCTWDDPLSGGCDQLGAVDHKYFLLSDTAITGKNHHSWKIYTNCNSTKYDNEYWQKYEVDSQIHVIDSYAYFIGKDGLIKYNLITANAEIIDEIGRWKTFDSFEAYYVGKKSSLILYKKVLYYNSPTEVKYYDLTVGKIGHTSVSTSGESSFYYGIKKDGRNLIYRLAQKSTEQGTINTYSNFFDEVAVVGIDGVSLSIFDNGMLGLNVYIKNTGMKNENVKIRIGYADDMTKAISTDLSQTIACGNYRYKLTFPINSAEMTREIKVIVSDAKGQNYFTPYTTTVRKYADNIMQHYSKEYAKEIPTIKAMLNYGAASQQYFGIRTGDLANSILTSSDKTSYVNVFDNANVGNSFINTYGVDKKLQIGKLEYIGSSLILESGFKLRHYFKLSSGSISDYTCRVTTADGSIIETPTSKFINKNNFFYVDVVEMPFGNCDKDYKIAITYNNQTASMNYNLNNYIAKAVKADNNGKLSDLMKALYAYVK